MRRLILFLLLILLLGGGIAYFAVPWNKLLEQRVTAFLDSRGIGNVSFKISDVGMHQATFENIRLGERDPLVLQSVTVQYQPRELLDGNLKEIALTGLDVKILQTEEGWKIAGIDEMRPTGPREGSTLGFSDLIELLPFSSVIVKESLIHIEGKSVQTSLPFSLQLNKGQKTVLEATINASNLTVASSAASLGILTLRAEPDEKRDWSGVWALESLDFGEDMPIPVLKGEGTLTNTGNSITIDGALASADKRYNGSFSTLIDMKASEKNELTVKSAVFPFKEGFISAKNTRIPFDRKNNITVNLDVKKVSLNDLMQTLTGQRVTATGTVSGRMPVILRPDGSYTLGKGTLKADGEGLIQMPPESIPGDNEKTQLVRDILKNLHYSVFSAGVDTSGSNGLVVRLSLEGNNPDVYNGRVVKLNINLTGDVLDFIQQNAMLFTNPEKLLEQGTQ